MSQLNTLGVAHDFLRRRVPKGGFCIDATAGRGRDTAFLCELVGEQGRVVAFDIQEEAVESTRQRVAQLGYQGIATVRHQTHTAMDEVAQPGTVDAIVFNFGYLPGGNHRIATQAPNSICAIEKGLTLLKDGGVMSLCIYHGGDTGYEERDALLAYLATIDAKRYTVLVASFHNRPNDPPIPVLILKQS